MKKIFLAIAIFITVNNFCFSQEIETENKIPIPKHEIGFTVGAFPLVGPEPPAGRSGFLSFFPEYGFEHYSHSEGNQDGSYEKMYHLGSFAMHYNCHLDSKRTVGISLSWVGRHIEKYDWYYWGAYSYDRDIVDGSGWKHNFTLQGSYRYIYKRKNNISFYNGIYFGATFCVRDKDILFKRKHSKPGLLSGSEVPDRYYFDWAAHITFWGIDIGTKHILNMELGIGTLGILRAGYKYKF